MPGVAWNGDELGVATLQRAKRKAVKDERGQEGDRALLRGGGKDVQITENREAIAKVLTLL